MESGWSYSRLLDGMLLLCLGLSGQGFKMREIILRFLKHRGECFRTDQVFLSKFRTEYQKVVLSFRLEKS